MNVPLSVMYIRMAVYIIDCTNTLELLIYMKSFFPQVNHNCQIQEKFRFR